MKRIRFPGVSGILILLCILFSNPLCVWAAPEDTPDDAEVMEELGSADFDETFDGYSDEEIEQALEEFFGSEWDGKDFAKESEVLENAPWTMTWQEDDGLFKYAFDEETFFLSNVPQGMVCTGPVSITFPENGAVLAYKDGEPADDMGKKTFTEPGSYLLAVMAYSVPDTLGEGMVFYKKNFNFRIVDEKTRFPAVLMAPEGFRLRSAALNGRRLDDVHSRGFFLDRDGTYSVTWEEPGTGVQAETEITLDTSAPFLIFSQDVTGGNATIPLEFKPSEDDARVFIQYNGFEGVYTGDTLRTEGYCRLMVEDLAGNRRSYSLHLEPEPEKVPVQWIVMSLLLLAGGVVWLLYLRRHMKII